MITNFPTQLGHMALATLRGEVAALTFGHSTGTQALQSLAEFHSRSDSILLEVAAEDSSRTSTAFNERVAALLRKFAAGEPVEFDGVPVSSCGLTCFQKQVVSACRAIRWGETVSYGLLARTAGRPGAARAVGTVMRKNRVPLIVPCHRVLASGGRLGGYSAPAGLVMKKRLLAMEMQGQLSGAT